MHHHLTSSLMALAPLVEGATLQRGWGIGTVGFVWSEHQRDAWHRVWKLQEFRLLWRIWRLMDFRWLKSSLPFFGYLKYRMVVHGIYVDLGQFMAYGLVGLWLVSFVSQSHEFNPDLRESCGEKISVCDCDDNPWNRNPCQGASVGDGIEVCWWNFGDGGWIALWWRFLYT